MLGYYWIVQGEIAGSPQPGLYGDWDEDIAYLKQNGLSFVVSLTEEPLIKDRIISEGFGFYHLPIRDMDAPMPRMADEAIKIMRQQTAEGNRVLLHCKGGVGRTGMMGACYLVSKGYSAKDSIEMVRKVNNAYIQTRTQESLIAHYEKIHS